MNNRARLINTSDDIEFLWKKLKVITSNDEFGNIHIDSLLEKLKNKNNYRGLSNGNYGFRGPLLSTIHASKGTEADDVILNAWGREGSIEKEEARVLFVGLTRSKRNVAVNPVDKSQNNWMGLYRNNRPYSNDLFSLNQNLCFHAEIGKDGDYDPYSLVGPDLEEQEIMEKGLICDDKPLPNFKKKKKEKIPPFPDKDLDKLYKDINSKLKP